jgi:two-component system response regulator YesN
MENRTEGKKRGKEMNVLIVDDDVPYLNSLCREIHWKALLAEEVYTAMGGAEAMEILRTRAIDLLITDIEMPGKSGLHLLDWCREESYRCMTIILSSFPDFSYAQRAISLGVFSYLLKTSEYSVLEDMIRRAMVELMRRREQQEETSEARQPGQIEKIRYYISEHISEEINRSMLAKYVGFSPEYLSSYFKKMTGQSLNSYINSEKIYFSQKMLLQTDLPISMIAQNLGFETSSYFTALFRKMTGMTPREFRKKRTGVKDQLF